MKKTTQNEVLQYKLTKEELQDFIDVTGITDCAAIKYNGRIYIFDKMGNAYSGRKGHKQMALTLQRKHDPKYSYYSFFTTTAHRLMALAFGIIDDINDERDIDHKNEDKLDNRLENLEAVSHKKNCERRSCRLYKVTKDGITYGPFVGQTNLAKFIGCDQCSIATAMSDKYHYFSNNTVKGYKIEEC